MTLPNGFDKWKLFTGDDGQQYLEVDTQVYVPPELGNANPEGRPFLAIRQPEAVTTSPYTVAQIEAMRGQIFDNKWNAVNPGYGSVLPTPPIGPNPYETAGRVLSGIINSTSVIAKKPEPEQPKGRFENLDWDES